MHLRIIDNLTAYDEERVARLITTLPDWRREAAMRYKFLAGKRECALGYDILRQLLSKHYHVNDVPQFTYNSHGKPSLAEHPDIHFSISHCKEAVGCITDCVPCGLDIERIRPFNESLARYTMNEQEFHDILSHAQPDVYFTALWTRKEALLKLRGTGIDDNLKETLAPEKTKGIELETHILPTYVYSITRERTE